jgi:hypothetical protein
MVKLMIMVMVMGCGNVVQRMDFLGSLLKVVLDGRPSVAETFTPSLIENIGKLFRMLHSWNVLPRHAARQLGAVFLFNLDLF